jgi:ABC-type sugar transport system ATPase subunit
MASAPLLRLEEVSKSFGRVQALDRVSLAYEKGQIYGLAGENGAGKSTLVKLLCGTHRPDAGRLVLNGQLYAPSNPAEAEDCGISVFHQEIPICPNLNVAQNVFLGGKGQGMFPNWKAMKRHCEQWFQQWLGIDIDSDRLLRDCTVAERQMTLLVRVLSRNAELIILDEPTTALTPPESARFFAVIRSLAAQGITFILVSHFLNELMELSARIDVLRDGVLAGTLLKGEFDADILAGLIAGRTLAMPEPTGARSASAVPRLEVRGLGKPGAFSNVSFKTSPGEIVGITGLQGSGRSALSRALFGAPPASSGQILIEGRAVSVQCPSDAIEAGIGYVPEDRQQYGLFDDLDVQSNLGLLRLDSFSRFGVLSRARLGALTRQMQRDLQIKIPSPDAPVTSLSGGNQQKVLIARWLAVAPAVLVMNEPTRGVDIGAKDEICRLLRKLADSGCCLILCSSDLDEVLRLAERILIMVSGRVTQELPSSEATKAKLIQAVGTMSE